MKIGAIKDLSLVDGEGVRLTLFLTGCTHACEGCHNPKFWNYDYGVEWSIPDMIEYITDRRFWIDGITLSGGDPLFQLNEVKELLIAIRNNNDLKDLNIWIYTGYEYAEIPGRIRQLVDVIVDGKYDESQTSYKPWRGSDNQKVWRKFIGARHVEDMYYDEE